jgi:hypothetical protein
MSLFCTERRLAVSLSRSQIPFKVRLPLLKLKVWAKDMSLPFARILEGLNIRAHA